ncbi:MAG: formate--tetrahydrofolate ligase [Planctomycetes bacterium]|nr:formate--tetrahydrofolate ligase [Planctomycetota bacterium]
MRSIAEVAADLGLSAEDWSPYGRTIAKVDPRVLQRPRARKSPARLVLVTAITPTPAGEGKTTTTIGLGQGLRRIGESVCVALREPSLGPCFGMKGGGTGGGKSRIEPSDRIDLHFTGDFHAVTSAHNLLAAIVDNHLHHGNALGLDPRRVSWKRVLDMNDRALRNVVLGLGGASEGVPRESGFDITAASEVMAALCLAEGEDDLRQRLERLIVGLTRTGEPVTAAQLQAVGGMLVLLRDALQPNLVQTTEGCPAYVHGGPFANIAHGCSSVLATRLALHGADWVLTEAGFGADLGMEKFFDIKCRSAGLDVAAVVVVATARAMKMHGGVGKKELDSQDAAAVERGLPNLEKHLENVRAFGKRPIVALNRFASDHADELAVIARRCEELGVPCAESRHFAEGGAGAEDLARLLLEHAESAPTPFAPVYPLEAAPAEKIRAIARTIYGARDVSFGKDAQRTLADVEKLGLGRLPICMAKTQYSFSDDPTKLGRPRDFVLEVRAIEIAAGAGFLVALTGEMMRMPGLPKEPRAKDLDLKDGRIVGW